MSYFPRFGLLPLLAMTVVLGATGCPLSQNQAAAGTNQAGTQDQSSDPAAANLAPVSTDSGAQAPAQSNYQQSAPAPVNYNA
jgi:hypothetical protein